MCAFLFFGSWHEYIRRTNWIKQVQISQLPFSHRHTHTNPTGALSIWCWCLSLKHWHSIKSTIICRSSICMRVCVCVWFIQASVSMLLWISDAQSSPVVLGIRRREKGTKQSARKPFQRLRDWAQGSRLSQMFWICWNGHFLNCAASPLLSPSPRFPSFPQTSHWGSPMETFLGPLPGTHNTCTSTCTCIHREFNVIFGK